LKDILLDYDAHGSATGDAVFIGKIGKILRVLNSNMNTTAPIFCPWTLKSIMLAEVKTVPHFVPHLNRGWSAVIVEERGRELMLVAREINNIGNHRIPSQILALQLLTEGLLVLSRRCHV
jgi:hypothetical protein